MALASQTKKGSPENIDINPESFVSPETDQENIIQPEKVEKVETKVEELKDEKKLNTEIESGPTDEVLKHAPKGKALSFHQRRAQEIDKILAEGMHDIFLDLNPQKQQEFKKAGEETVVKINELLDKTKVNVDKIINLIKKWLKIVPGINHFFLEQDAKIKADKILNIKDKA